jgi:TonB-linked SusC/RagA family outer membrane protein
MRRRSLAALTLISLAVLTSHTSLLRAQDAAIITGRVTSEFGAPLGAANILIEELRISVSTAADGHYSVAVPGARATGQSVVLRARSIGYLAQQRTITIVVGPQTQDFTLRRDINRLEEIVVTGTVAATAQKNLPFSVTRLDSSDMPVPGASALLGIQGKVPGAQVVQPTGRPGVGPAVVLRGPKSINATGRSQSPLVILDGLVLSSQGLQDINPQDIESIEVVRGAAASSLYGSRAAMGVIQITTKSGRRTAEGTHFTVRSELGYRGTQNEFRYARHHFLRMDERNERFCIKVTNQPACSRTVDFEDETRRINDGGSAGALTPWPFERDYGIGAAPSKPELKGLFQAGSWPKTYDPIAQIVVDGQFASNTINVDNRSGRTGYFASLSDFRDGGALRYLRGYHRGTARANIDQIVGDHWDFALRSAYTRSTEFPAVTGPASSGTDEFFQLQTRVPAGVDLMRRDRLGRLYVRANPLNVGGGVGQSALTNTNNPLYDQENTQGQLDVDRLLASLQGRYSPTTWLSFDATASTDRSRTADLFLRDRGYRSSLATEPSGGIGYMQTRSTGVFSHNLMANGVANGMLATDLHVTLRSTLAYEQQEGESSTAYGEGFVVPGLATLGNTTTNFFVASNRSTIRAKSGLGAAQLEYKGRYIVDGLLRYDGSSLFGADERWHAYTRASAAWRVSDEPFWPVPTAVSDLKLRASVGTAGSRPNFASQYQTFAVSSGQVTPITLGNKHLKPENTRETELGLDAELFRRAALSLTYARDITTDELLLVPAPFASGYPSQWANAGALDGKTWELSLRLPLIAARSFTWTAQVSWDRSRTYITDVDVPPYYVNLFSVGGGVNLRVAPGERYGTMYGRRFVTRCSELPAPFDAQCGPGREWQTNDEGYVVWVGQGRSQRDGVALNLWQATRPGCVGASAVVDGVVACLQRGGTVNAPWGVRETNWGMPLVIRDSTATPMLLPIGNTLPDYRLAASHAVHWKRLDLFAVVDASVGNDLYNVERQWSFGDFMTREQDQNGKTPETAKPIGYYWRATSPVSALGVGGFYDELLGNNRTVEDASYVKLRELSITYSVGRVPLAAGRWSVSLIGRNLYTWTRFTGWDPEVGRDVADVGSPAIAAVAGFQYPPTRAFTLAFTGRY